MASSARLAGGLDQARLGREQLHDPGEGPRVAEHAGCTSSAGRERHRVGAGVERGVRGEPQPHDGLERRGCAPQRLHVGLDPGERQQRPHLDDRRQLVAQRAGRQVVESASAVRGRRAAVDRRRPARSRRTSVASPAPARAQVEPGGARRRSAVSSTVKVTERRGGIDGEVERVARNDTSAGGSTPSGRANA